MGISLGPVPMMYKTLQRGQMRGLTAADRHQCKGSEENRSHARVRVSNASVLSALACRAPSILANLSSRMVSGARDCRQDRFPLESGWPGHLIGNIALSFLDFGIRARGVCLSRGGKPSLEWLERTYTERDPGLAEMKADPLLKSLGRDPRYAALLKKIGLPL